MPYILYVLLCILISSFFLFPRYNITTEMELIDKIIDDKGLVGARHGELFAKIILTDQLNEDSDAGELVFDLD